MGTNEPAPLIKSTKVEKLIGKLSVLDGMRQKVMSISHQLLVFSVHSIKDLTIFRLVFDASEIL